MDIKLGLFQVYAKAHHLNNVTQNPKSNDFLDIPINVSL